MNVKGSAIFAAIILVALVNSESAEMPSDTLPLHSRFHGEDPGDIANGIGNVPGGSNGP